MRFLHIIQRYHPAVGGSEWYVRKLSEGLVGRGHSVTVLTTTALDVDSLWRSDYAHVAQPDETINGVEVRRVRPRYLPLHGKTMTLLSFLPGLYFKGRFAMPGPLLPGTGKLSKIAGEYDFVHASALPFTSLIWAAHKLAEHRRVPLVISPFMHLDIPDRLGYGYKKGYQIELLKKADRVIAQTQVERNALIEMGVAADKIRIVGLGLDDHNVVGDARRFRELYNLRGPIVFNLSARTFDKGAIHTVDAMRILWEKGVHASLVMAGPARDDYKKHVAALPTGNRGKILDLGVIDEQTKADLFAAGDIFCMPSRSESFGIVYLESWDNGHPVIAARSGAVPEIVSDGVDGLLVEFGDSQAIAAAIEKLLTDEALRIKMGQSGKAKVLEKYRWQDKFNCYLKVLEELGVKE